MKTDYSMDSHSQTMGHAGGQLIKLKVPDFLELKPMGLKTGLHVLAIVFENKRMGSSSRREVRILLYFEFTHMGLISNIYINFVHFLKSSACAYYQTHAAI